MESKFIALNKDGEETEWLRNFLEDFPCWAKPVSTIHILLWYSVSNKKMHNDKSRHNTIKHFLLNEIISINYVKSKQNIVDSLTKNLLRELMYDS